VSGERWLIKATRALRSSIFDPEARPICRGKAETEFGYKVRLTESKERLITEYDVLVGNPPDNELLVPGIKTHVQRTGQVPEGAALEARILESR